MRASRLLRILLILQNRGRTSTRQLAEELEVARRTILRDVDALTEAGLPIIVHRGNNGGVELGFDYRSRLLGLTHDEAAALGVVLGQSSRPLHELGMAQAGATAVEKLLESLPNSIRDPLIDAQRKFRVRSEHVESIDPRIPALVDAINRRVLVRLNHRSPTPREVHPVGLSHTSGRWALIDALDADHPIPEADWGDINISGLKFAAT